MQNVEIEISILISMMTDGDMAALGMTELHEDSFSIAETQNVFLAMKKNFEQGRQSTLINTGFPTALHETALTKGLFSDNLMSFKDTLNDLEGLKNCRKLVSVAEQILHFAKSGNFDKAQNYALERIGALGGGSSERMAFKTWGEVATLAKDRIENIIANGLGDYFIPSGYANLDERYGGFPASGLIGVGARSKVGKSTLVLPTVLSNADKPVFMASTEVTPATVAGILLAIKNGFYRGDILKGKLSAEQVLKYIDSLENFLAKMQGGVTMQRSLSKIVTELKWWRAKTDINKPAVAVLDFLNDITDPKGRVYRYEENIPDAVSILKGLALELNLSLIALSQFNKGTQTQFNGKKKDKQRPEGDNLIGSGAFFQSADVILLPHRPTLYLPPEEAIYTLGKRFEPAVIIVDKFKDASATDLPAIFDGFITQFISPPKIAQRTMVGEILVEATAAMMNQEFENSLQSK